MAVNDKAVLVYATFPTLEAAEAAAGRLVEARLSACANILPGMISIYRWEGGLERGQEVVMIAKTTAERASDAVEAIRRHHPYELPAILVLPVEGGHQPFLDWIGAETSAEREAGET